MKNTYRLVTLRPSDLPPPDDTRSAREVLEEYVRSVEKRYCEMPAAVLSLGDWHLDSVKTVEVVGTPQALVTDEPVQPKATE